MQPVNVLGEDDDLMSSLFEGCQRLVRGIRFCLKDLAGKRMEPVKETLRGDARTNWEILAKLADPRLRLSTLSGPPAPSPDAVPDLIVDALVGTGFTGALEGRLAEPSGLGVNTDERPVSYLYSVALWGEASGLPRERDYIKWLGIFSVAGIIPKIWICGLN